MLAMLGHFAIKLFGCYIQSGVRDVKKASGYDQETPHSNIVDQPTAQRGSTT